MRLSAALVALSAAVAHAGFGLNFGGNQVTVNEDLKIPGDSPLELCPKAHDKDIITIDKVDLVPNPPKACVQLPSQEAYIDPQTTQSSWLTLVFPAIVDKTSSSRPPAQSPSPSRRAPTSLCKSSTA